LRIVHSGFPKIGIIFRTSEQAVTLGTPQQLTCMFTCIMQ